MAVKEATDSASKKAAQDAEKAAKEKAKRKISIFLLNKTVLPLL